VPTSPVSHLIRFDIFELDLRAGELRKGGLRIRLQEQPLLVLQALLENPGEVVTSEELQKKIWPADTFVDFDHGLHAAVNRLRAALNDSAERPRYVETVARRGYRFIGRVESPSATSLQSPSTALEDLQKTRPDQLLPRRRHAIWNSWTGSLSGFGIAVVIGAMLVVFNVDGLRDWLFGRGAHRPFRSLAVLPLEDVASDPSKDYISEGMTEDLTTQLSKLQNLKVISHTSVMQYKQAHKPLPEIARELNVDAIVEGAVQLSGNHVRITAQLVDAATDQHLWAQTYDRELKDVLILQSEVAQDIAKQIALELTPQQQQHLTNDVHQVNPEAYQDYWLGRYYWNQRPNGLAKAGQYFQQAIQKDPNYALAYSGLSDYFAFLTLIGGPEILPPSQAMPKAKQAAAKAVQLDDSSAEAHASNGHILHNYDWDWEGAERELKRAIELNPNYAPAHHWYAHLLMQEGRTQEALTEAERAVQLDPMSPFINGGMARQYYLARQYDKSIAQCLVALEKDAAYPPARIQLALNYEQKGMLVEAVSELEKARALAANYASGPSRGASTGAPATTDLPIIHGMLGYAYARAGRTADAQNEFSLLTTIARHRYVPPSYFAIISLALGKNNDAFVWLNKAYGDHSEQMLYMGVEPIVDPLRGDPRFDALLQKVGLKH
jgi:TolB-like protein/DNA-binding winged helix-turn-helix (wHTH) protein/Flp pilus assembly protein TadD